MAAQKQRIIIAGGGLGGLAAACRLALDGHDVELYERSSALSTASGAIFVRSNGVRCFYRWQLREAFEAVTAPIQEHETRNALTGDILHRLDPLLWSKFPEWSTDRQALQGVLYEQACRAGAKIYFGRDIVDVQEDESQAYAIFKDGSKIAADLLLAADGISSRLRPKILAHLDPALLTVIRSPSTHYPTEIPADVLASDDRTRMLCEKPTSEHGIMWAGQGGYAIGKFNNLRGLFNCMFSIQHGSSDSQFSEQKLFDADSDVSIVRDFFASYHPTVATMANQITSCSRWRLARLDPLDTWSSTGKRLVLLGDSAHAMLPNLAEGFSSIVEDVDALSLILETRQKMAEVIKIWEEIRIPRVKRLQEGSTWNYALYNVGKPPGSELTEEDRNRPAGDGDGEAPFNTPPFVKWTLDYDTAAETRRYLKCREPVSQKL